MPWPTAWHRLNQSMQLLLDIMMMQRGKRLTSTRAASDHAVQRANMWDDCHDFWVFGWHWQAQLCQQQLFSFILGSFSKIRDMDQLNMIKTVVHKAKESTLSLCHCRSIAFGVWPAFSILKRIYSAVQLLSQRARMASDDGKVVEVYGTPFSQPTRAVWWLCKLLDVPHEFKPVKLSDGMCALANPVVLRCYKNSCARLSIAWVLYM